MLDKTRRKVVLGAIVAALVALLVASPDEAPAFYLLEGDLEIHGWLRTNLAVQLTGSIPQWGPNLVNDFDNAGTVTMWHTLTQLEVKYTLMSKPANIWVFWIPRLWYEARYDLDTSYPQTPTEQDLGRENMLGDPRSGGDFFREMYVNIDYKRLNLRVGKQQVVWGESDGFRLADIINPLDFSWHYFFPPWEDIRKPLPMVWARFDTGRLKIFNSTNIEVVWIPTSFEPNTIPHPSAPWGFPVPPPAVPIAQGFTDDSQILPNLYAPEDSDPFRETLENGEVAVKFNFVTLNGWEMNFYNFYHRDDIGVANLQSGLYEYKRINTIGMTWNKFLDKPLNIPVISVFRGECTFNIDVPFNKQIGPTPFNAEVVRKKTFDFVIGIDRNNIVDFLKIDTGFLGGGTGLYTSFQLFGHYILDHEDGLLSGFLTPVEDWHSHIVTLLVNTTYMWGSLTPQVFMAYGLESNDGWVQPSLAYRPQGELGNWFKFVLGANVMWAENYTDGNFGPFHKNNEIYFEAEFAF